MRSLEVVLATISVLLVFLRQSQAEIIQVCVDESNSVCRTVSPHQCYDEDVRQSCCDTCSKKAGAFFTSGDCRFGDRAPSCKDMDPRLCYDDSQRAYCCQTCRTARQPDLPEGCEYGDRAPAPYCQLINYHHCKGQHISSHCCASCHHIINQRLRQGLPINKIL